MANGVEQFLMYLFVISLFSWVQWLSLFFFLIL